MGLKDGGGNDFLKLVNQCARPFAIQILRRLRKIQPLVQDDMVSSRQRPTLNIKTNHSESPPNHSASKTFTESRYAEHLRSKKNHSCNILQMAFSEQHAPN